MCVCVCVCARDGYAGLRTSDLPLRPVLTPQSNTVGTRTATTMLVVQLHQTSAEGCPTLLNSLVVDPLVLTKSLGHWIIRARPKAMGFRLTIGGRLEHVMSSGDLE